MNRLKEDYVIFKDRLSGKELCAYAYRGTFPGERKATIQLLAYEKKIPESQIIISYEKREYKP